MFTYKQAAILLTEATCLSEIRREHTLSSSLKMAVLHRIAPECLVFV